MKKIKNIKKKIIISILFFILVGTTVLCAKFLAQEKVQNSNTASVTEEKKSEDINKVPENIPSHSQIYKVQEFKATTTNENVLNFTLIVGDKRQTFSVQKESTLYEAFQALKSKGELSFEGKNYPGLGFFVTQIGDLKSEGGKNLMYDINGVEASVGVSSYVLKEGDIIEWKLK